MLKKGFIGFYLLLMLVAAKAAAQDIQFTGSARSEIALGETFSVTYKVNGQAMNFSGPSFSDFQLISGPNPSTSSVIQSINGRTSMSISNSYTYLLQAVREGTFDIPSASVTIDNKVYKSNKITVKVVRNPGSQQGQNPGQNNQGNRQSGGGSAQVSDNDVL